MQQSTEPTNAVDASKTSKLPLPPSVSDIYQMPFKRNLRQAWRLLTLNLKRILIGTSLFVLRHPVRAWPLIWQRLRCVFIGSTKATRTPQGFQLKHTGHYYIYSDIFITRALYNPRFIRILKKVNTPIIVDVGANCGLFSQWIGGYNASARFICFEPCHEFCVENRRIQLEAKKRLDIQLYQMAVTDRDGKIDMHVGELITIGEKGRVVEATRLDTFKALVNEPEIFLIKIDTDGSNWFVLEGARGLFARTRFVLIEKEIPEELYCKFFDAWSVIDLGNDFLYENTPLVYKSKG